MSKFLDEKQLCAELGISPVTTTKWRRKGEGPPFIRVGRLIRYSRAALDEWLAARTVGIDKRAA
jgi:excisionase family DNA binding protein